MANKVIAILEIDEEFADAVRAGSECSGIRIKNRAVIDSTNLWQRYTLYLVEWAISHNSPEFEGMAPACFQEWVKNELGEEAGEKVCKLCGQKMIWEHPNLPGHFMASSCYIGGDICYDCMSDHCNSTNCLGCELGEYPNCSYNYLKDHNKED